MQTSRPSHRPLIQKRYIYYTHGMEAPMGRGGTEVPRIQTEGYETKEGWESWEEGETGVPAKSRGREKCPVDVQDWWQHLRWGLTYNNEELLDGLFWRAGLAEAVGTATFTYFLLSTWESLSGGGLTDLGVLRVALSAGLTYAVLNWAFHGVSGGHFNPAVTLGLCFNTAITVTRAIMYWIAQLVGAVVGAAMARAMLPGAWRAVHGGANRLNVGWRAAFMGELFGTMLLVGTFLVAYDRRRRVQSDTINVLAPWMLGVAVTAAHLYLTPFTWCSINPARSFGAAVISGFWSDHWIWWVAPIIGAIASSLLYETFFKHMWSSTLDKIRGPGGEAQPAVSTSTGYP